MPLQIAVDGPAGSGKSTAARRLARELGLTYLDTGAFYRCVALAVLRRGVDPANEAAVTTVSAGLNLSFLPGAEAEPDRVFCDGEDVSEAIRRPEISRIVSLVAAYPAVREKLTEQMRRLAAAHPVIMDGRDIGTHVLPEADIKIFLTASSRERARRRWRELETAGRAEGLTEENVLAEIEARDREDSSRAAAPLRQAEDARLIDATRLNPDEVAALIRAIVTEYRAGAKRPKYWYGLD
ncbi:MAG: (d)CMP kinase [Gracilibacteraceae bacterium]|jgi:cytidylate kinase|nr:(d)CMP kinase [Gracilibacteraceae bacterium]